MSGCPFHHGSPDAPSPSVMEVLKASTSELHDAAEGHTFQQAMVQGRLPREQFAAYLGQLLLVHATLEKHLRAARLTVPPVARVVQDYQFKEANLRRDLAFYGVNADAVVPMEPTSAIIRELDETATNDPLSLLGYHYVLEGSMNGNRFIARAVAGAYRLPPGEGVSYLDPYGDQQRAYWAKFKADMDACGFSPAQMRSMAEAARSMFRGIGAISAAMGSAVAA